MNVRIKTKKNSNIGSSTELSTLIKKKIKEFSKSIVIPALKESNNIIKTTNNTIKTADNISSKKKKFKKENQKIQKKKKIT